MLQIKSITELRGIAAVLLLVSWTNVAATQEPSQPGYVSSRQLSGLIRVCGSPQMGDMLHREEVAFQRVQPSVHFENKLQSTVTAVAGVASGRADVGLLGREIWPSEQEVFSSIAGRPPAVVEIATGSYDVPKATFALMIFVNSSNPLQSLSLEQLAVIFGEIDSAGPHTWSDAGLGGAWTARPIHLYGFARNNDKARIFRMLVFSRHQDWAPGLHELRNAAGPPAIDAGEQIVRAVAADPEGIGIANVHYMVPGVRILPIAPRSGAAPVMPSRATVADRSYPLTRSVYAVFDAGRSTGATPAVREFLRFLLSREGQDEISRVGIYLPLTPARAASQRSLLATSVP